MPRHWKVLMVVSIAVFMATLDLFIVNIAFPDIQRDFGGSSVASVSWVLNAYAIVFAALLVPAGRLADRVGRRRAFLGGVLVFALGSLLCGAAPSVATLVAARTIQAAGGAFLIPTSLALLLPEFPPQKRAAAIGVWAAVGGVAAATGPPLGGLLVEGSWRLVFLVNLPVGVLAFVLASRVLRESRDESSLRPDLLGTVLLTVAVGLFALGLVKAPEWGWGDYRTLVALAAAAAGLVVFWRRCLSHPSPVVEPSMLKVRSFALAGTASLLFSAAFAAMLLSGALFMTSVWGESVLRSGVSLSPGPLMAATFAPVAGLLANRVGQRRLAAAGMTLFALGCAWWLWQLGPEPDYAGKMLPGMIVTGIGVGLTLPSLASAAAASLPPARFATGSGVFTMSRQLGFVLGVAIWVAVVGSANPADPVGGFEDGWLFMIIAAVLGVGASVAIGEVRQHAPALRAPVGVAVPRRLGQRGEMQVRKLDAG